MKKENFLWVEKYRPSTIDECILPARLKNTFNQFVEAGEIPNMLLTGSAGVGKTTIAKALCKQLGSDVMVVNASENGNIDTLRTKIRQFASTVSLFGTGTKVVILDEADYLTSATQPALRNFMEEFSNNCRFILTANFANRIIEPLHSRCTTIDFNFSKKEVVGLAGHFMKRCENILKNEGIKYEQKVLAEVIKKYLPDFRKILNELQRHGVSGVLDGNIIGNLNNNNIDGVIQFLKKKEFTNMRKWCAENADVDTVQIMRSVINHSKDIFQDKFIPNAIMIYNRYDYQNAFVTDKEINLVAFFTELMVDGEFK